MAGLIPAIHVFLASGAEDVDARHKVGHDEAYGATDVLVAAAHFTLISAGSADGPGRTDRRKCNPK
jgi:hypothetical protein